MHENDFGFEEKVKLSGHVTTSLSNSFFNFFNPLTY